MNIALEFSHGFWSGQVTAQGEFMEKVISKSGRRFGGGYKTAHTAYTRTLKNATLIIQNFHLYVEEEA